LTSRSAAQNLFFFTEMAMEVVLFTIGHGIQGYIDDKWEIFDVVICFGAAFGFSYWNNLLSGALSGQATISNSQKIAQIGRAFRLLRLVRLMQFFKPLQRILETLYRSMPQLMNILLLLFTIYSIFAVIAVNSFGTVKYGRRFGPTANFNKCLSLRATVSCFVLGLNEHCRQVLVLVCFHNDERNLHLQVYRSHEDHLPNGHG
jgi:hypothetical protein